MNRYSFLLLLAGVISFAMVFSQTDNSYSQSSILEKTPPGTDTFIFVQTIVRNSEGQLLAYLGSNEFTHLDVGALDRLLDIEASENDPIFTFYGKKYQVIKRTLEIPYNKENVIASTILANNENGKTILVARFAHDGYLIVPGDMVTSIWTFFRPVN